MTLDPTAFALLRRLVEQRTGVLLDADASYLPELRLDPIAREAGCRSVTELILSLRGSAPKELERRVVEAMLTRETSFFRDWAVFEALRKVVLPELRRPGLRVLSAGCASGQEPYTLAMLLQEHEPELAKSARVIGLDVSADALAQAATGLFSQLEVNRGLPAPLLVKHFEPVGAQWRARPAIRQMIDFVPMNLLELDRSALPSCDLILMRNVMIYFELETRRRVLGQLAQVLAPSGLLILGSAESLRGADDLLESTQRGPLLCYRRRRG